MAELYEKVVACFAAAATATGCTFDIEEIGHPYEDLINSPVLVELFDRNISELGRTMKRGSDFQPGAAGSTDMGNVSHVVPSIHPFLAMHTGGYVNHQPEFAAHTITPDGEQVIRDGALAMAWTVIDVAEGGCGISWADPTYFVPGTSYFDPLPGGTVSCYASRVHDYRKLTVWRDARSLVGDIYRLTGSFPPSEGFGLTAQMRRAAVSIVSNVAEGAGRSGQMDFARFVSMAIGSTCELEAQLDVALDLSYVDAHAHARLARRLESIKFRLSGLERRTRDGSRDT